MSVATLHEPLTAVLRVCYLRGRSFLQPLTQSATRIAVASHRHRIRSAILLAVVMIVLLIILTVGWVIVNVFGALNNTSIAALFWTVLPIGTTFILLLVVGVVMYLGLSVKAINLNHRQSNFVDSVTHELKSPIASLKLYLQTLGRRQLGQREQADFHRSMLEEVERLDRLINQVLDAGRIDAAREAADTVEVPLDEVLRGCAELACLRYRLPLSAVRLDVEPSLVRAARVDLDLIFRNLIDNAIKYGGAEPQVVVHSRLEGRWATTRISDNGQGIPPKLRRKIFGRFVRLGSELERERPGTGLGLHIARSLVQRLRGVIRVSDGGPLPGATFEVRLPAKMVHSNELPAVPPRGGLLAT